MTALWLLLVFLAAILGFSGGAAVAVATRCPGEDPTGFGLFLGGLSAGLLVTLVDLGWVELQLWGLG